MLMKKATISREYFYNILLVCSNKKEIETLIRKRLRVNGLRERQRGKYYSSSDLLEVTGAGWIRRSRNERIKSSCPIGLCIRPTTGSFVVLIIIRRCDPSLATPTGSHIYESQTVSRVLRFRYSQPALCYKYFYCSDIINFNLPD